MSIEQEARAEAEKRWPGADGYATVVQLRAEFTNGYIAGASRPVTDAEADAAQTAFHEYVIGADEPLTERDLSMGRQAWKVALEAAREAS
ncbi:hypothetical protein ACSAGD_10630 [Paramicrobacterium sp. CJ85]|uniref:hypothetical protein n=1 Tax=Paramicrobacterium sp. CJ85 TaxID=3445355 RepID=UPI003F646ED8